MRDTVIFSRDELDLIVALAACTLDESPGSNWVQKAGGLPDYICRVARAIKRSGKTTSQAISIAVSRMKKWATGAGVDADTQAKATKALAEWEKLRAKSHAKSAAKKTEKVATTHTSAGLLCLTDYNVDIVRAAFDQRTAEARRAWRTQHPAAAYEDSPDNLYVNELWNTFIIAGSGYGHARTQYKIPYTVADDNTVSFGEPVEVKTAYVAVSGADMGDDITDAELQKMLDLTGPCAADPTGFRNLVRLEESVMTPLERIVALAAPDSGPLERVVALAAKTMKPGGGPQADADMPAGDMMAKGRKMMQRAQTMLDSADDMDGEQAAATRTKARAMMARAKAMMARAKATGASAPDSGS